MVETFLVLVLAAFAGGAFGASIGALPAFVFTGVLVIAGEVLALVRRGLDAEGLAAVDVTATLAFGPFGPHVSFAGGAAAVAYAARKGYVDPDFEYHPAKLVTCGVSNRPDVLVVGGVFGVVGHLVAVGSEAAAIPWDPVAFGVVASALAHRAALGYSIVGKPVGGWFDMSPFERGERRSRVTTDSERADVATDGGTAAERYAVEPWLPHQYRWSHVAGLGLAVGVLGAYVAYLTGSAFLAFGISVTTLVYANAGVPRIPITHHITLPASTVVLAAVPEAGDGATAATIAASLGSGEALVLGAVFGLLGALAGEFVQRIFYAHAETHLDPPAASIVVTTLLLALLAIAGVLPHAAWIPVPSLG